MAVYEENFRDSLQAFLTEGTVYLKSFFMSFSKGNLYNQMTKNWKGQAPSGASG